MKKAVKKQNYPDAVTKGLSCLLANTYLLYLKTQNFHWHVTGPNFYSLHKMFEDQYEALAEAVDVLAERLRAMSARAPASFTEFLKLTTLKEATGNYTASNMINELFRDHQAIAKQLEELFAIADASGDEVTLDLLIQRKTEHDKTAWMLKSSLK